MTARPLRVRRAFLIGAAVLFVVPHHISPAAAAGGPFAGALGVPAQSSFDRLDNGDAVQVRVLSGRADLVSGGDALVEIAVPAGTALEHVRVTAGSRDVTGVFRPAGPGLRGLVSGLPNGSTAIVATLEDGASARLLVTNAPQGGPVFSGPLITPWSCGNDSKTPDCGRLAPTITYSYKSTGLVRLAPVV